MPGVVVGRIYCAEAGIKRFEIYDVAQEDSAVAEFVTPDHDGLERKGLSHRPAIIARRPVSLSKIFDGICRIL
jgi:hypothetical protein